MGARAACVLALALAPWGCGSSSGGGAASDGDGGVPNGDGGGGSDAGNAGSDGAATDGGVGDATPVDASGDAGACSPQFAKCARPPAGATLCGSGAIDPAAAAAACSALDPPMDLHQGVPKACSAFSITAGHYEVWCAPSGIYVWVSFDSLASSAVTTCMISTPLPDGGTLTATYYELSWNLFDNNDSVYAKLSLGDAGVTAGGMLMKRAEPYMSSDRTTSASSWQGSSAFDGLLGGTTAASGAGNVYFAADQQDCHQVPTPAGFQIVLAAPVHWGF